MKQSQKRSIVIDVVRDSLHFSAAHFTIFSASERENLHGHNFKMNAQLQCQVGDDGIAFDYSIAKRLFQEICDSLDETTLIPELSPHLEIQLEKPYVKVMFAKETMFFLERDITLLPVRNITVEELAYWLLDEVKERDTFKSLPIEEITVRVASGSGQWGVANATV